MLLLLLLLFNFSAAVIGHFTRTINRQISSGIAFDIVRAALAKDRRNWAPGVMWLSLRVDKRESTDLRLMVAVGEMRIGQGYE